jgi:hypothetical protein
VFFKHKYLTMPTITPADALILAADNLTAAIAGVVPPPNMTVDAIDQLMNIFKLQAEKEKNEATIQRVLKDCAQAERVRTAENTIAIPSTKPTTKPITKGNILHITPKSTGNNVNIAAPSNKPTTSFPRFEVEYPDVDLGILNGTPLVSQDDDDAPSANTQLQPKKRTITQDYLFHMMDIPFQTQPFTNKMAASRNFPLQFLCNFASAVLDDETGDLFEYHHLLSVE